MIFLEIGNAYMGRKTLDKDGKVIRFTPASFEADPKGGCVALGRLNPETMEQDGPAAIYGDWDAAHYLEEALRLLNPSRAINIPDFKAIVQAATQEGNEDYVCEYCKGFNCRDCIITEWREEN